MDEKGPVDDDLQRLRQERLQEMEARLLGDRGGVFEVADDTFQETVRAHPSLVVDVWAEWCGPCRMVAPVIEDLAREFSGRVAFSKCNVDENPRLAAQFSITAIPTLLFFANGMPIDRVVGALPKEAIKARVMRAFGTG